MVKLVKYPPTVVKAPSVRTIAEDVFTPLITLQFLIQEAFIVVVPVDPNHTAIGDVTLVFSIVRSLVVPFTVFEPSIVA